jgi:hypothetical protein
MPYLNYKSISDGVDSKIEWTPLYNGPFPAQYQVPTKAPKIPITLGEEMEAILREWHSIRGKSISPEEIQICRETDLAEGIELQAEMAKPVVLKYTYGTPEFWKDWWARKKAKENGEPSIEAKKRKPSAPKSAKQSAPA